MVKITSELKSMLILILLRLKVLLRPMIQIQPARRRGLKSCHWIGRLQQMPRVFRVQRRINRQLSLSLISMVGRQTSLSQMLVKQSALEPLETMSWIELCGRSKMPMAKYCACLFPSLSIVMLQVSIRSLPKGRLRKTLRVQSWLRSQKLT